MAYIQQIKFREALSRLAKFCLLLFTPLFVGCTDDTDDGLGKQTVPVTFYLQASEIQQTRAYVGELTAESANESNINTIKVWFFDGTTPVCYSDVISDKKVTINVPQTAISKGTVDAYIIANSDGLLSTTLGENSSLTEIQTVTIAAAQFSVATPVTAVPAAGLPMSRIVKGLSLVDESGEVKTNLGEIKITRAVSKIHFAFGMYEGDFGEIIGISLDGEQIATQEYIMAVDPSTNVADYTAPYLGDLKSNIVADNYETSELLLGAKTGNTPLIANVNIHKTSATDNPSNYTWTNWSTKNNTLTDQQKAVQYNTAIKPFVTNTVYLRESDKKLTGKIYYRMSSEEGAEVKTASFEMDAESTVQDFARNHVWIVYAYFEGGKLYVKPTIADWIDTTTLEYTVKMKTNIRLFDSWLYRYDLDKDYEDYTRWATSHMVVSDGKITEATTVEPVTGRPIRSPQIQLVTTGVDGSTFELAIDNENFELVQAVKNDVGVVTSYTTSSTLTIQPTENLYTYFYIVPKEGVTWTDENRIAKVYLFYNDPVLGKQKVPYNSNTLPGYSDDSSEIWVYYVPAEDYNITDKLKMYYQDYNNPLVPTPVQS